MYFIPTTVADSGRRFVSAAVLLMAIWPPAALAQQSEPDSTRGATRPSDVPGKPDQNEERNRRRVEYEFDKHGGVTYRTGEDYKLTCDVYVPHGAGPYPTLLAIHGGGWASGNKFQWFRHARKMARAGFVVVAINYRHAPKYKFPAQIHDCKAAVRWIRKNAATYKVDSNCLGGIGYSAGGHLIALLGTSDSNDGLEGPMPKNERQISTRLQAVAVGGGPCNFDWIADESNSLAYWLGASRAADPEIYRQASPTSFITKDDPPFCFYHGSSDRIVPSHSAEAMHQMLLGQGLESEFKTWTGSGHITTFTNSETIDFAIEFFDLHLRGNGQPRNN